ncbi:hypothetical protein [Clostridium beijerinckii]|uniref:Pycsar effector protein domain-containing protein n=1 Tax=Clostridium beijerinckii TaxID=1520 RepID=A0AAX0BD57_CLOBE|nr:hypothetical protein [Clostridium beijerinckii]NRT92363.1 hypothetical protein [Clostridium beijerinckii]NYC75494.1 flagellar biogenesis protein FliO [Clostridium beijerinckii]
MSEKIDFATKKELVYKSLEDTTNTIRFIDTKVAALFVAIGVFITILSSLSSKIYDIYKSYKDIPFHSFFIALIIIGIIISIIIAIYYGFKTLGAQNSPLNYVNLNGRSIKNLWHLVTGSDNKITKPLSEYITEVNDLSEDDYLEIITVELMKTSGIRNEKIKSVNKSFLWFKISLSMFAIIIIYILCFYSSYKF